MTPASKAANTSASRSRSRRINYHSNLGRMLRDLTGFVTLTAELLQNADDDARATRLLIDIGRDEFVIFNDAEFSDCGNQDLEPEECLLRPLRGHLCDFHSFRDVAGGDKRDRAERGNDLVAALVERLLAEPGDPNQHLRDGLAGPTAPVTSSPTPPPASDTADNEDASEDDSDDSGTSSGDQADQEQGSGDCDAYLNSSGWCEEGIGDYDCAGGSSNGPNYVSGPVTLVDPADDPFRLDESGVGDGIGCEDPAPEPEPEPEQPGTDPRFDTCGDAIDAGYGVYYRGQDPEYDWLPRR